MFGKKKKQAQVEEPQVVETEMENEQFSPIPPMQEANNGKVFLECELIDDDDYDDFSGEYVAEAYNYKQDEGEALFAQPVYDEPALIDDDDMEPSFAPVLEDDEPMLEEDEPTLEEVEPALEEVEPTLEEVEPTLEEVDQDYDDEVEVDEDFLLEEVEENHDEAQNIELTPVDTQEESEEIVYVVDGPSEDDDEIVKPAKLVKLPNLVDYMISQNMSKKMKINVAMLLLSAYKKYKDIPEEKKIIIQCMAKIMRALQD